MALLCIEGVGNIGARRSLGFADSALVSDGSTSEGGKLSQVVQVRQQQKRNGDGGFGVRAVYNGGGMSWPVSTSLENFPVNRPAQWQSYCAVLSSQSAVIQALEPSLVGTDGLIRSVNTLPQPLSISRSLKKQPRVAYQGVPGAYSEAAARKSNPNADVDPVPCQQFDDVFKAVELWLVDEAVLPIENSLGGTIHRNYDLMLRHSLHIVGEVQLPVNHCLMALPGVRKQDVRRVISHPQALSQTEHSLNSLLGAGVIREDFYDTAGSAQAIAVDRLSDTAAVASARAAEIYGLEILAEKIQDDPSNVTRFLMLNREPLIPSNDRPFKTSIVFALDEGPGQLFRALGCFANRDINLSKIEGRPQGNYGLRAVDGGSTRQVVSAIPRKFKYVFYLDFEASMADVRAQNALGNLQEFATFLRVLGSYPMDTQ